MNRDNVSAAQHAGANPGRPKHAELYWIWRLLLPLATGLLYYFTLFGSITATDGSGYPLGADVHRYAFQNGYPDLHPLTSALLTWWRMLAIDLFGLPPIPEVIKFPFAAIGAANSAIALALFSTLFDRGRAVIYAGCYSASLMVWYFASAPESYIVSIALYALFALLVVTASTKGWSWRRAAGAAAVLYVLLWNDVSAVFLTIVPLILHLGEIRTRRDVGIAALLQTASVALFFLPRVAFTDFAAYYLGFFKGYSPIEREGDGFAYNASLIESFEPILNFFVYPLAAPADSVTHATARFPHYFGFFEPSLAPYVTDWLTLGWLVVFAWLVSFFRPAKINRLVLAFASFVALRLVLVLLFNPGEAILYASVTVLPLLIWLFHFLDASQSRWRLPAAASFLALMFALNARFFLHWMFPG